MKTRFISAALWLAVLVTGLQLGGSVYEHFVITPLWAGSPPASVRNWNPVPEFAIVPGEFWVRSALAALPAMIGLFVAACLSRRPVRLWCLVAALCSLAVMIATGSFFVPILQETILNGGADLSDAEIVRKVHLWTTWNSLRFSVGLVGWIAAIIGLKNVQPVVARLPA